VVLGVPGGALGDLGASWGIQAPKIDFPRFLKPSGGDLGGQVGVQNFTFMLQNLLKKAPRGVRRRFERVSKKDLKKEGSEDRFSLLFWRILGAPGEAKMWSILRTISKFWLSAHLELSYLLDLEKYRF